jgi:hypothetical protein
LRPINNSSIVTISTWEYTILTLLRSYYFCVQSWCGGSDFDHPWFVFEYECCMNLCVVGLRLWW